MDITYASNPDGTITRTTTQIITAQQASSMIANQQNQLRDSGYDSLVAAAATATAIVAQQAEVLAAEVAAVADVQTITP